MATGTAISKKSTVQYLQPDNLSPHGSVPTYTDGLFGSRFILWSDIQRLYRNISYLELDNKRVLFEVDEHYQVREPLRILYSARSYVAVLRRESLGNAKSSFDLQLQEYSHLCTLATKSRSQERDLFLPILSNVDHQRASLLALIEKIKQNRVIEAEETDAMQRTILTLDRDIRESDNFNVRYSVLSREHHYLEFASPRLFLVLPANLDRWVDHVPETHNFRLYFMCEFDYGKDLILRYRPATLQRHLHVCDHAGYDLDRAYEFFQRYGQLTLAILELIKFGFSSADLSLPPLRSFKILKNWNGENTHHILTEQNIEALVDKTIVFLFLKKFVPSTRLSALSHSAADTRAIRSYLCSSQLTLETGDLYRNIIGSKSFWLCQGHSAFPRSVDTIRRSISSTITTHYRAGTRDIQLKKKSEIPEICSVLQWNALRYNMSLTILCDMTLKQLLGCLNAMACNGTKVLQIDGVSRVEGGRPSPGTFFKYLDDYSLRTYKNEPFDLHGVGCLLVSPHQPRDQDKDDIADLSSKHLSIYVDWLHLVDAVGRFVNGLLKMKSNKGNKRPEEMSLLLNALSASLASHKALDIEGIQLYDKKSRWHGTFEVKDGIIQGLVDGRISTILPSECLAQGALRRLVVLGGFHESLACVHDLMSFNPRLQIIYLPIQDNDTLGHIALLSQHSHASLPFKLILTLRQWVPEEWRVVAEVDIQLMDPRALGPHVFIPSHASITILNDRLVSVAFQDWDRDHVSETLKDTTAVLFDAASRSFPLVLTSLDLNVSALSQQGLACVDNILRRSALERLHIRCVSVRAADKITVGHTLRAVQWPTVKTLVLSGDHIDEWIDIWIKHGHFFHPRDESQTGPRLWCLIVYGSGITDQPLSHASAVALHWLVYTSPLLELHLENIRFQEKQDWSLIITAIQLSSLDWFHRPRSHIQHVKVSVLEQTISTTTEDDLMISASVGVKGRRANKARSPQIEADHMRGDVGVTSVNISCKGEGSCPLRSNKPYHARKP